MKFLKPAMFLAAGFICHASCDLRPSESSARSDEPNENLTSECNGPASRLPGYSEAVNNPDLFSDDANKCVSASLLGMKISGDENALKYYHCEDQEAARALAALLTKLNERIQENGCAAVGESNACDELIVYLSSMQKLNDDVSDLLTSISNPNELSDADKQKARQACAVQQKADDLLERVETAAKASTCKGKINLRNDARTGALNIESALEFLDCAGLAKAK